MKILKKISFTKWLGVAQLITDIAIVTFAYYTGFRIQRTELYDTQRFFTAFPSGLKEILIIVAIVALMVFMLIRTYKVGRFTPADIFLKVVFSMILIALLSIFVDFAIKGVGIWRQTTAYAAIIECILLLLTKLTFQKLYTATYKVQKSVIISYDIKDCSELLMKTITVANMQYDTKKILFTAIGINSIKQEILSYDRIFITEKCESNIKSELIEYCLTKQINCSLIPSIPNITVNSGTADSIDDIMLLGIKTSIAFEYKMIKRLMDILISSICLLILSPVFLIVSILIYIEDKHNPFFVQQRVTKNDRIYQMYKFRTMLIDAEKDSGAVISTKDDARITKTGKFLRRYRVDEIPQFWNILMGDMSIVGPRPERMELIEKISQTIPEYRYRTVTKAGLTGLAQISGWYDTSYEKKLKYDLYYVNHCSIILDIKLILKTASAIIKPAIYNEDFSNIQDFNNLLSVLNQHDYTATLDNHVVTLIKQSVKEK